MRVEKNHLSLWPSSESFALEVNAAGFSVHGLEKDWLLLASVVLFACRLRNHYFHTVREAGQVWGSCLFNKTQEILGKVNTERDTIFFTSALMLLKTVSKYYVI